MRNCIGIRKEDKDPSERRAPLTPAQVAELVRKYSLRVIVEPAPNRIYSDSEYQNAGAELSSNLNPCNIIFGVKEIPIKRLLPEKALCFFSHTIKGQPYNMPMLKRILEIKCTLIDYELVADEKGKRLIFFGNFAGYAGMIDSLWALGKRLESEGISTPFSRLKQAYQYASLEEAKREIQEVGKQIQRDGLPQGIVPLIVGFTGRGHVSRGAQEIFDLLPFQAIPAETLPEWYRAGKVSDRELYKVVFLRRDIYAPKEGDPRNLPDEFFKNPENVKSKFENYLGYLTLIINGIYWEPSFPRLITRQAVQRLYGLPRRPPLRVIGDITCDVKGSIELTVKATSYKNPVYVYEPEADTFRDGWEGSGPVILAVDKLPAEMPREASEFFGAALLRYVPALAKTDFSLPYHRLELPAEFRRAIIAHQGKLTPDFTYLEQFLSDRSP